MWFWWLMLICNMIIPVAMLAAGRMMWKHYPKQINSVVGYRTARSMKNMDTWKFAHEYCGKLWWKIGSIMIVPSVVIFLPFYHSGRSTIATVAIALGAIQLVAIIASIFPTEAALKKRFNDDGTQR